MGTGTTKQEFNPTGNAEVAELKALGDDLIKSIELNVPDNRRRRRAIDQIEVGCMLAVKAIHYPEE